MTTTSVRLCTRARAHLGNEGDDDGKITKRAFALVGVAAALRSHTNERAPAYVYLINFASRCGFVVAAHMNARDPFSRCRQTKRRMRAASA